MDNSHKFSNYASKIKNQLTLKQNKLPTLQIGTLLLVLLIIFSLYKVFHPGSNSGVAGVSKTATQTNTTAKSTFSINKDFTFSVNAPTELPASVKFNLDSAELKNQVVLKGTPANLTDGRIFLTLNLKISNDNKIDYPINTRRYFRLIVNNKENEPLAPAIYNDPVDAQAEAVTPVSLGFIINQSDKDLKLKVGEVGDTTKEKEVIDLKFTGK